MSNANKISFSKDDIDAVIQSNTTNLQSTQSIIGIHVGCTSVIIDDSRLCIDIPYIGEYCFDIPSYVPRGKAEVCLDLKTIGPVPIGAKITIKVNGYIVYELNIGL